MSDTSSDGAPVSEPDYDDSEPEEDRGSEIDPADDVGPEESDADDNELPHLKSLSELSSSSYRSHLRRERSPVRQYQLPVSRGAQGKVIADRPERTALTGNRIVSMPLLREHVLPHLQCPSCKKLGRMQLFQQDEGESGLAGDLRFRCTRCDRLTINMPTSEGCPSIGKRASSCQELNFRAVLAGYNSGIGFNAFERFFGIMNIPCMSENTWRTTQSYVDPICDDVGSDSMRRAAAEERQLSFDMGNEPDDRQRYPIPLSFDAQWLKPGRGHNAPDGYGVGIGGLTRKVLATDYRTKAGPLKNHEGSSGSMEPIMGAAVCKNLSRQHGVYVSELCMDLDAKTPKAVREMCESEKLPLPTKRHDPNHFVKVAKGKFIEVKKKVKVKNVFPPATQLRLAQQFAMALHQHRKSGDPAKLRGALLQVKHHAFNEHDNCHKYFKCPVARGLRQASTYKNGEYAQRRFLWINMLSNHLKRYCLAPLSRQPAKSPHPGVRSMIRSRSWREEQGLPVHQKGAIRSSLGTERSDQMKA